MKLADELERLMPVKATSSEHIDASEARAELLQKIAPHLPALLRALEGWEAKQIALCRETEFIPSPEDDAVSDSYRALEEAADVR